jgi:hypothetical protein
MIFYSARRKTQTSLTAHAISLQYVPPALVNCRSDLALTVVHLKRSTLHPFAGDPKVRCLQFWRSSVGDRDCKPGRHGKLVRNGDEPCATGETNDVDSTSGLDLRHRHVDESKRQSTRRVVLIASIDGCSHCLCTCSPVSTYDLQRETVLRFARNG